MSDKAGWTRRSKVTLILVILAVILIAFPIVRYFTQIQSLQRLTALPTIESEPDNRAAYYLAAAEQAVPVQDLENLLEHGTLTEVLLLVDGDVVEGIIAANQTALDTLSQTYAIDHCRMPLLFKPGTWGGYEFTIGKSLRDLGGAAFWSTLRALKSGDLETACAFAILNLRLGRDVASAGSFDQAQHGMYIYQSASAALAAILTQQVLPDHVLIRLQDELPDCRFPRGFDERAVLENHFKWSRLAHHDTAPVHIRLIRAYRLGNLIDIRGYNLPGPDLSMGPGTATWNPLMEYPSKSAPARAFPDGPEGLGAGLAMLEMGVAVQRFFLGTGEFPMSTDALLDGYLPALPASPVAIRLVVSEAGDAVDLVSAAQEYKVAPRTLRFERSRLTPQPEQRNNS
jgi:hypothetical protein